PIGVALTTPFAEAAAASSSSGPIARACAPTAPMSAARPWARSISVSAMTSSPTPSSARANPTARPAPPAPICTTASVATPARRLARSRLRAQRLGTVAVGVGDDDVAHTEFGQGAPDRTAGSAGADLHDRPGGDSCQPGPESGGESGVATEAVVQIGAGGAG